MSFFEELKRRNVFRVGIAYGIASWFILQVADLVLENIGSPPWVIQTLMFLVGLGFIAALIIAWAYELTPEGIKKEADVVRDESVTEQTGKKLNAITLAAVMVLLVFMVLDRFVFERPMVTGSGSITQTDSDLEADILPNPVIEPDPISEEKSIAVLPFVDMSPDGDQAYFADGIAEEILNVLVKTHSLKVAGRTSSFQFRNREEDLRLIGEQLGVENILEGSVRKAGNRIRITAQLVKANDGFHLWSETYDRELVDVFAIQDEIAMAITEALAIELHLAEGQASIAGTPTLNMKAYDRYLEGRALIASRSNFPQMLRVLEEATKLDPKFAQGWAARAQAWALTFYYGFEERNTALREAELYARHAIELDPELSEGHSALGDALRDQLQWNQALESYKRALELNPDNIETHSQLGQMFMRAGFSKEAVKHSSAAVNLDPLSWVNQSFYAVSHFAAGRYEESQVAIEKAVELTGSSRSLIIRFKVRMDLVQGKIDEARETVVNFEANPLNDARTEDFYFLHLAENFDDPEQAKSYLRSLDPGEIIGIGAQVFWPAYFEDYDLAKVWLDNVMGRNDVFDDVDLVWMQFPPLFPLFGTAEFKNVLKRGRMDVFWREYGWPTFCRPKGALDFECEAPNRQP